MSTVRTSSSMQMQGYTDDETSSALLCLPPLKPYVIYEHTIHLTANFATVLWCDPSVRQFHSVIHLFYEFFKRLPNSLLRAMLSAFYLAHRKCFTNAQFFLTSRFFFFVGSVFFFTPFAHATHDGDTRIPNMYCKMYDRRIDYRRNK